jgi:uncharacterized protein (DUF952 family)
MTTVYKIVPAALWREAERDGVFRGAAIDLRDGYIHLSTAAQLRETARLHFAGIDDLLVVAVDAESLGEALRFEPSRGGDLFPHLYAPLPVRQILFALPMPLGAGGVHRFPERIA